jgi:hypothetical protein
MERGSFLITCHCYGRQKNKMRLNELQHLSLFIERHSLDVNNSLFLPLHIITVLAITL